MSLLGSIVCIFSLVNWIISLRLTITLYSYIHIDENSGMGGCGATVCADDITTCYECLGGPGFAASGQYAWVPEISACVPSCDEAPADASCFKGKSSADPDDGYDPSICEDFEDTCPSNDNGQCDFEPNNPHVCFGCSYENICLAEAAGYDIDNDCCQSPNPSACGLIFQPLICGSKQCRYDNLCLAELSGYSETQCTSTLPPQPCTDFGTCGDCLDASCSWSPDAGMDGECLESCTDAPADGSCYSPEFGHDASTCPTAQLVWEQAAPALKSSKSKDYFGSENQLDASGTRFLVSAKKSSEAGLKEAGMVKVYDIKGSSNEKLIQVGQTLYGFRDGDEIQGVLAGSGKRLVLFTHTRDDGTGRVWVYELRSGQWVEIGKIIGEDGERFGQTAAISNGGEIIAVGASFADSKRGLVRAFRYQGGSTWTAMGPDIEGLFEDGKFGWDISMASASSAPTMVVGQKSDDSGDNSGRSGQVRVFRWNADKTVWRQVGDAILGENPGDSFGRQVAINSNGNIFAAGARYYDGSGGKDSGAAYVFENVGGGEWADLDANIVGDGPGDQFMNVAMNAAGTRVAVGGGSGDGQVGYAKVYDAIDGSGWTQIGNTLRGQTTGEGFGSNLSLSPDGSRLLVGSPARDNDSLEGSVRLFELVPPGTYDYPYISPEVQSANDAAGTRDATSSASKYSSSVEASFVAVAFSFLITSYYTY